MLARGGVCVLSVLLTVAPAAAQPMYDPQYCYILDGLLLLYGVVITAFFVRERFVKQRKPEIDPVYQPIMKGGKSEYAAPDRTQRGSEEGRAQGRRRVDDTYTPLNKKTDDTYRELENKPDRRRQDQVYQGLSSATKDTYDGLHMKQLHPPPR